MLKTTVLLVPVRSVCIKANENKFDTDSGSDISGNRIESKMANLSSSTKKMISKAGFLTFEAYLAFT